MSFISILNVGLQSPKKKILEHLPPGHLPPGHILTTYPWAHQQNKTILWGVYYSGLSDGGM